MVIQQNPNMSTLQLLKLKTNSGMRSWTLQLSACTIEIERRTNVFLDSWLSFPKWLLDLLRPRYEQSKKTETNWEFWFWPTQCVWKNMKQIWWSTCLPIWGTCRVCVCANSVYQSQLYPWSIPNVVSQRRHLWVQGVKVSERIPRTKF